MTIVETVENKRECRAHGGHLGGVNLGERQRRRNLEIEEQQNLILDLDESCRRFRREGVLIRS